MSAHSQMHAYVLTLQSYHVLHILKVIGQHGMAWQRSYLRPPFTGALGSTCTLSMHIYDILSEHIAKSINCPRNSLALSCRLSRKACEGKKPNSESATSVMITRTISSHELSSLDICRPLNVSAHCCLVFV